MTTFATGIQSRGQCYKTFWSVIFEFSQQARVFVRLGWKRLSGANSLAYYENLYITHKHFHDIGPWLSH
jgi:hypothetical protein